MLLRELSRRDPAAIERAKAELKAQRAIDGYFPEEGPQSRASYPRHMEFIRETGIREGDRYAYREGLVRFANQTGKTTLGGYLASVWLTGQYPAWWNGRRFARPIKMWACGETAKKVREVLQVKLFGESANESGIKQGYSTGLIPGACVGKPKKRTGVQDALDFIPIRSKYGLSKLVFKSYEEGWQAFESDVVDVVWFDEEPEDKVYSGGLMRTITKVDGYVFTTVTPLMGLTPFQMGFMAKGRPSA